MTTPATFVYIDSSRTPWADINTNPTAPDAGTVAMYISKAATRISGGTRYTLGAPATLAIHIAGRLEIVEGTATEHRTASRLIITPRDGSKARTVFRSQVVAGYDGHGRAGSVIEDFRNSAGCFFDMIPAECFADYTGPADEIREAERAAEDAKEEAAALLQDRKAGREPWTLEAWETERELLAARLESYEREAAYLAAHTAQVTGRGVAGRDHLAEAREELADHMAAKPAEIAEDAQAAEEITPEALAELAEDAADQMHIMVTGSAPYTSGPYDYENGARAVATQILGKRDKGAPAVSVDTLAPLVAAGFVARCQAAAAPAPEGIEVDQDATPFEIAQAEFVARLENWNGEDREAGTMTANRLQPGDRVEGFGPVLETITDAGAFALVYADKDGNDQITRLFRAWSYVPVVAPLSNFSSWRAAMAAANRYQVETAKERAAEKRADLQAMPAEEPTPAALVIEAAEEAAASGMDPEALAAGLGGRYWVEGQGVRLALNGTTFKIRGQEGAGDPWLVWTDAAGVKNTRRVVVDPAAAPGADPRAAWLAGHCDAIRAALEITKAAAPALVAA